MYTPPGYAKRGPTYPLVVVFDGPAAVNKLALPIILDELIAAKRIPPTIVVMVGNANRKADLGADDGFADFVANDIVPWARKTYHATNDPKLTVVAGISLGGLAASHLAARHSAVFGNVLSQSGAYIWFDDSREFDFMAHAYAEHARQPIRFWMECGTLEPLLLAPNRHFRDVLLARGYDVTYSQFVGVHSYLSWRGTIADGLVALLGKPPKLTGKPSASSRKPTGLEIDAGRKTLAHVIQRMAILDGGAASLAKLKQMDAALTREDEINDAAYALLELQRPRDALPIFEWNAERFAKSANAHDSLAEALYHLGENARAVVSYKRSLALDPKNENAKKMIERLQQAP